jgi:hypothetical protein
MVSLAAVATVAASGLGGCTFGEQPEVSIETRNLTLRGEAGEVQDLERVRGEVTAQPVGSTLEEGTTIELGARFGQLASTFDIQGNLGALCTGSTVELEARDQQQLEPVHAEGAPARMLPDLRALRVNMVTRASDTRSAAGSSELRAQRLTLRAVETDTEFARVEFESQHEYQGEMQQYGGSFEIARVEQDPDRTRTWD